MRYSFTVKGQTAIDFRAHSAALAGAVADYNRASRRSRNVKQILGYQPSPAGDTLHIELDSSHALSPGREGNALWFFSHALVDRYGFGRYLDPQGKLLRSV